MYKLIDRYILKSLAGPLIFGFVVVLFLFLMQFMLNYLDDLVGKGLDTWVIIQLIALNLAWMVVLAVPIGFLFATLLAFGGMSASHEITIMKASGASLYRMMMPVIILGILLTLGLFWFNDYVLPEANFKSKNLMNDIRRKKPIFSVEAGQFTTQLEGYTILARNLDSARTTMYGVTIYDKSNVRRTNVVSADSGTINFNTDYSALILRLNNGEVHQIFETKSQDYRIIKFTTYRIIIDARDFAFERSEEGMVRGDRERSIEDMQEIVDAAEENAVKSEVRLQEELDYHFDYLLGNYNKKDTLGAAGLTRLAVERPDEELREWEILDRVQRRLSFFLSSVRSDYSQSNSYRLQARQYDVEIQKKYAIPVACFVFLLVGCPLGIVTRGGNFGVSAAISLGFYIFYWACLIGGEKLADRGLLSPFVSMWAGNFIVGLMGIFLTIKVNNETITFPGLKWIKYIFKRKKT